MIILIKRKVSENGAIYITVEKRYLGGLIKFKSIYSSDRVIIGQYREWVKEPNKLFVHDALSFQLDKWNRTVQDN